MRSMWGQGPMCQVSPEDRELERILERGVIVPDLKDERVKQK